MGKFLDKERRFGMKKRWIVLLAGLIAAIYIGCFGNCPPRIISILIDPSPAPASDTVRITCEVEDPDNDSLTYRWTYPLEFSCIICRDDLPTLTLIAPESTGTYNFSVDVKDERGGKAIRSFTVEVKKNHSPEIISITMDPRRIYTSDTVKITCEAEDRDGDPLEYNWTYHPAFFYIGGAGSAILNLIAPADTGTYEEFIIEVRDNRGGGVVDTFDVVVNPRRGFN